MKYNILIRLINISFIIVTFLSLHTISTSYTHVIISCLALAQTFLHLPCLSILYLILYFSSSAVWLFFLNVFSAAFLHPALIADICLVVFISFITLFATPHEKKWNSYKYLLLTVVPISLYSYIAYNTYLYWAVIISIPLIIHSSVSLDIVRKPKVWLKICTICTIPLSFMLIYFNHSSLHKQNIAVLQSKWCNVAITPDNKSFKTDYYYSYSDFAKLLQQYGNTTIVQHEDITKNTLFYDTLILIMPTQDFSTKEVENIKSFVFNGGRLVVIADHTNLYGHADNLNSVLKEFNTQIIDDSLYDHADYYKAHILHINNMTLTAITSKTNSSVMVPFYAKVWATSSHMISEKADYTRPNFFGTLSFTEDDAVGSYPVGVTVPHGLGEVVIWTDSTIFSNFAISQKQYIEILDYLLLGQIVHTRSALPFVPIHVKANNNLIFRESPPSRLPRENHFSTLIANFTRYGFFPLYGTDKENNNTKKLYFLNYQDYLSQGSNFYNSNHFVLIYGDIPKNNIFTAQKKFFDVKHDAMCAYYYTSAHNTITTQYQQNKILFAKNIFSDNNLGTWWNTTPVSPYKETMTKQFFQWLLSGADIFMYDYPSIHEIFAAKNYVDKNGTQQAAQTKISRIVTSQGHNFVYLGQRKWAIHLDDLLLGGAETSDCASSHGLERWKYVK